ncbi:uncharacterized protein METZ01_LOCUS30049 [marine metagenome]|uniref:Uncharacterized protein n=1 Tax=marine metagenome TaxID=408172 RepID=A0A381QD01_9ZZZZ
MQYFKKTLDKSINIGDLVITYF